MQKYDSNSAKKVHPLFLLLNFLYSDISDKYDLLPNDKHLLIILVKHCGIEGIYPSQMTLANELRVSDRYIRERITSLKNKGILYTKRIKRRTHYLVDIQEVQFLCGNLDTGTTALQYRNHSSGYTGTTVPYNKEVNNIKKNKELLYAKHQNQEPRKISDFGQQTLDKIISNLKGA